MGDVLSQSQIDALLSAAHAGTLDQESSNEKKVRKYDFHTPKKFTRERLKLINGVYENYARRIDSYLTSIMRMDVEVEILAVEEQRYYEFNNALSEEDILAFVDSDFFSEQSEKEDLLDPILFQMSMHVIHGFVDRLLGGNGDKDPVTDDSTITEVETVLYESILQKIVPIMDDVWEPYINAEFKFARIESNPRLIQAIGMDEIVVIVAFSVRINEIYGQMNICLPSSILDFIFKKFEESSMLLNRRKEFQTEEEKAQLFKQIQESELEIIAHMDYAYILLDDLFRIRPGDIINLAIPKSSTVTLDVGGNEWFTAKMGVYKDNKAVKIESVIDPESGYQDERV